MTDCVDDSSDQDLARIKKACSELSEHFDSVRIFATRYEGGDRGTQSWNWGEGNFWASYGRIRMWVLKEEEGEKTRTRLAVEEDEDRDE